MATKDFPVTTRDERGAAAATALVLAMAMACAASCRHADVPAAPTELKVPRLVVGADASWTGLADGDAIVAVAGGIPIPADRYRRALMAAGPDADARQVLDGLVSRELLAQEAVRTAAGDEGVTAAEPVYQRALASRMLRDRFVEDFRPGDVPEADLQEVFRIPQVFGKFNHLRIYVIQDYQWICCGGEARSCATPEADSCFQDGSAAMAALHEEVVRNPPDPEDMPLLQDRYRASASHLSYQEFEFAYDDDARVQKGAVLIDDSVVEAALLTDAGHFAPKPVRSRFGWHVMYVKQMLPPVRSDLGNPDVRREVSEFFYARFQQKKLVEYLITLVPVQGFRMLEAAFKDHLPAVRPRYPITLYVDTLAEAIEATRKHKEEEPL